MDLRKGTITENGKKINWQQTDSGILFSDGKTAIPLASNMDAKLSYKGAIVPIDEPKQPEAAVKFDNVYFASNSLTSAGIRANDGDSVSIIPDSSGKYPLKYAGVAAPILTGRPPILHNNEILFDNEPNSLFNSDSFPKLVNYPYEETLVLRVVPGTGYEQFQNDWNNDLSIGDSGGKLRAGDADVATQTFDRSEYQSFKVIAIHLLAESGKQTMWLNGKEVGAISSRLTSHKILNSIGVNTNNAQWNFLAKYVKLGKLSDLERSQHLASVNDFYKVGSLPVQPYASDVSIIKAGVYTAKYKYNGTRPQNIGRTEYRWLGLDDKGLGSVKLIGTGEILPLISASPFNSIRVEVKVYDVDGNSFRYISHAFLNK